MVQIVLQFPIENKIFLKHLQQWKNKTEQALHSEDRKNILQILKGIQKMFTNS